VDEQSGEEKLEAEDWDDGNGDNYNSDFVHDVIYDNVRRTKEENPRPVNEALAEDVEGLEDFVPAIKLLGMVTNEDDVPGSYIGNLNDDDRFVVCPYCDAKHFYMERLSRSTKKKSLFGLCCGKGKYVPSKPRGCPEFLKDMYMRKSVYSSEFFRKPLEYNTACSMAAVCATPGPKLKGGGPPVVKISGEVRYTIAHPLAFVEKGHGGRQSNLGDGFSNVYLYSKPEEAAEKRMTLQASVGCSKGLLTALSQVLVDCSPWVKEFKNLQVKEREWAAAAGRPVKQQNLYFKRPTAFEKRKRRRDNKDEYNAPNDSEVSVVYIGSDPPAFTAYCVWDKEDRLQVVPSTYGMADPLAFSLLFPLGDMGYDENKKEPTCRKFYASRLFERVGEAWWSPVLYAGKLLQKYLVLSWIKCEGEELEYIRQNQAEIRAEKYYVCADQMENDVNVVFGGVGVSPVGRRVILPATHTNSRRMLRQNYMNVIALSNERGPPDFFITMTTNTKWPEITESLHPGEKAVDRPEVVARVFYCKLLQMWRILTEKNLFGEVVWGSYRVEFQQRGLPHAHIVIKVKDQYKLNNAACIDRLIRADVPDPLTEPRLHECIAKHNMHSKCGHGCMCWDERKNVCSKYFPKPYCEKTKIGDTAYVQYRRPAHGSKAHVPGRSEPLDSAWVIPYNPYLSLYFDCHINVEKCASSRSIKYLYKYLNKTSDAVFVATENPHDEIANYVEARCVGACEAAWRLLEYPVVFCSHSIMPLPVHLPDEQDIFYQGVISEEKLEQDTKLTAWFRANDENLAGMDPVTKEVVNARDVKYSKFPRYFWWNDEDHRWESRQKRPNKISIGRMHSVSLKDRERFYLRTMLLYTRGAVSFSNLLTVDGYECGTFEEACKMSGYLRVDEEWELAMAETATFADARQLRCLFAYIIIGNEPSNVNELWEKFKEDMMQDYLHLHTAELRTADDEEVMQIREECEAACFNYINRILRDAGVDFATLLDDSEIYLTYEEEEAERGIPLPEGFYTCDCSCFVYVFEKHC
jgi:hypothetical protein